MLMLKLVVVAVVVLAMAIFSAISWLLLPAISPGPDVQHSELLGEMPESRSQEEIRKGL
jgi:hypothetical protein